VLRAASVSAPAASALAGGYGAAQAAIARGPLHEQLAYDVGIGGLALCGAGLLLTLLSLVGTGLLPPREWRWPAPPEDFAFRRHWGSFGGESTGWSLSPRLARLLAGIVMMMAGAGLVMALLSPPAPDAPNRAASPPAAEKPASGVAAKTE